MMKWLYWSTAGVVVVLVVVGGWFFFLRDTTTETGSPQGSGFGVGGNQTVEVTPETTGGSTGGTANVPQVVPQKIMQLINGPVVGATVVQYTQPTTTVARYVQQNNGHVFDLVLDSSGAVPKAVSNTTIPGVARTLWTRRGEGVILQYLDGNVVKTVSLGFPSQQATTTEPVTIKFLPDGISDLAVSPNGASVAYTLRTQTGVRGYVANVDGTGSRELFTLPLKEIVLTWPSQGTLFAYTKTAFGVSGVAFAVNTTSGAAVPLLHAEGLSLTADPTYSYVIYQTSSTGGNPSTYVRTVESGQSAGLSYDPYPERCVWGTSATTTLYCAAPIEVVPGNYLDQWHAGGARADEALYSFTFPRNTSSIVAVPGGDHGGVAGVIDSLAVSPDGRYLLYIIRGERSLWGVRL